MDETDVVEEVSEYLNERKYRFFVDSGYGSNQIDSLEGTLENCGLNSTMTIEGRVPDIIGTTPKGHFFAIEAKGDTGIRKGIGQAVHYRQGVHKSFIAAPAEALDEFEDTALSCGVGLLRVNQEGDINREPPLRNIGATKLERTRRALAVKTSRFESAHATFPSMARPENAFLAILAIEENSTDGSLPLSECKSKIRDNPDDWNQPNGPISLARTLQLVEKPKRDEVRLTDSGDACYYLIRGLSLENSHDIYDYIDELKKNTILHNEAPEITAFLRDRYLAVPDVRLLMHVIASYEDDEAELSRILSEIALSSPDTFLNLFCGRGADEEFRELVEEKTRAAVDEDFRRDILSLSSSNSLYNFVYQIRTIGLLGEGTEAVPNTRDAEEIEIGEFHWSWSPDMVGETSNVFRRNID